MVRSDAGRYSSEGRRKVNYSKADILSYESATDHLGEGDRIKLGLVRLG